MIKDYQDKFDVIPGLSDHTLGTIAPIVATSLGARLIEKHFILDRSLGGPDSSFSLNQIEFQDMVKAVRDTEKSLGQVKYSLTKKQKEARKFSRSLYVVENVKKGEIATVNNIKSIRPGFGMHPKNLKKILGKKFIKNFSSGTRVSYNLFKNNDSIF
jgi:pseudaminic acid synthase